MGVAEVLRQPPALFGLARARWRLADLRVAVPALAGYGLTGLSALVRRLKIGRRRGRLRLHSPDVAYREKVAWIERARAAAVADPDHVRLLYGDEVSLYRQPTLAPLYAPRGEEPTRTLSHRSNTRYRVSGALDALSGQVVWSGRSAMTVKALRQFLRRLRAAYPTHVLLLVWDNWPVHQHPDVLAEAAALGIQLLWLPTYAPWLNPIEKLWRWLKQDRLHQHRLADDWPALKATANAFLDQFATGSDALLRYVGLLPD